MPDPDADGTVDFVAHHEANRRKYLGALLAWVVGGAVVVVMLTYQLLPRLLRKPVLDDHFHAHPSVWNKDTAVGAALFGIRQPMINVIQTLHLALS